MNRTLARFKVPLAAAAVVAASILLAPHASAQGSPSGGPGAEDLVVLTGSLDVPAGETVKTAVIFDGDATIEGTVLETLVVFNGSAEISGSVGQDVVVFNGPVVVRSGAVIGGDLASRKATTVEDGATVRGDVIGISRRLDLSRYWWAGRLAWWIGYSVSTLVLGLVLLRVARGLDAATARAMDRRMGAVFGFGALTFFLAPVVALLLIVTVVGIPLGMFLLLAFGLVYTIGYVVGAMALGRFVVKAPTSRYLAFLAGWGALRLVALVPFIGGLTWAWATVVGLGVLWVASSSRAQGVEPAAAPPPPPPQPAAA